MRAIALALLVLIVPRAGSGQPLAVLHVKVVLADADGNAVPMPRVALLVSDNPATAEPRRIVTRTDGTADVRLRPGNYTVESDRPIAFRGRAYQWTAILDVSAGETVLELTAKNAEVGPLTDVADTPASSDTPVAADSAALLAKWQDSVVEIWTPTTHASGFLIDGSGLVATNNRVIGDATSVEVQIMGTVKVAGRVLVADRTRDVAILWIDPRAAAPAQPASPACAAAAVPAVEYKQELFTMATPLLAPQDLMPGTVSRVESRSLLADFRLEAGSTGGPVFTSDGTLIGLTTTDGEDDGRRRGDSRVIFISHACEAAAAAQQKMAGATPPPGTRLPVEPAGLKAREADQPRNISPAQFQISSSDFDIAFVTPALLRSERFQSGALSDFGNWSAYVTGAPPVLLVRVTPKLEESFWTMLARGAAQTQGIALPPMKRFTSNFSRMRAYCGDAEVTPIHPFTIERRFTEKNVIQEGLYVFDPRAFGTQCATIRLVLYSEKEPQKGDTRTVDPKLLQQLAQDFVPF